MIIDITEKKDTIELAKSLAKKVSIGKPILLYGTLGCGKTFFASHLIKTLTQSDISEQSPSFTIVQIYPYKSGQISHYDLYRIKDISELFELDIEGSIQNNITIIEWPEIIEDYIKENFSPICLYFTYENGKRYIEIKE